MDTPTCATSPRTVCSRMSEVILPISVLGSPSPCLEAPYLIAQVVLTYTQGYAFAPYRYHRNNDSHVPQTQRREKQEGRDVSQHKLCHAGACRLGAGHKDQ